LGELHGRQGRGQVVARDEQALDASRQSAGDDLVAICIECRILQMAVRVDQAGQSLRGA